MKYTVLLREYKAPALLMQRETVEVILNPVSRFVPGADGAVDLNFIPAYDDIANLYLMGGEWRLHYAPHNAPMNPDGLAQEFMTLSEGAVIRVLDELIAHAAPCQRLARSDQGRRARVSRRAVFGCSYSCHSIIQYEPRVSAIAEVGVVSPFELRPRKQALDEAIFFDLNGVQHFSFRVFLAEKLDPTP
jgi:hypothetical protein